MKWGTYVSSFFFPVKVEKRKSLINNEITVEVFQGHYRAKVGGYIQSGAYARNVLSTALDNTHFNYSPVKKVLILGLGAGTMIEELNHYLRLYQLTGVDIDREMITIGEKYFGLKKYKNLKIVAADAYDYLSRLKSDTFDLIISDLFVGCDTDPKLRSDIFVGMIHKHLSKSGVYVSNNSYLQRYKKDSDDYVSKVTNRFDTVEKNIKGCNLLIIAYKK